MPLAGDLLIQVTVGFIMLQIMVELVCSKPMVRRKALGVDYIWNKQRCQYFVGIGVCEEEDRETSQERRREPAR
jgi:hypothetical protein